jgi:hypothetical protein
MRAVVTKRNPCFKERAEYFEQTVQNTNYATVGCVIPVSTSAAQISQMARAAAGSAPGPCIIRLQRSLQYMPQSFKMTSRTLVFTPLDFNAALSRAMPAGGSQGRVTGGSISSMRARVRVIHGGTGARGLQQTTPRDTYCTGAILSSKI